MAYRGASADFPEHSVGAYRAAIEQGARFVECDVVLSRDLVPLCRHEPNIAQTTDVLLRRRRAAAAEAAEATGRSPQPELQQQSKEELGSSSGGPASSVASGSEVAVLASDLTLEEIKRLRAIFPAGGAGAAAGQTASATAGSRAEPAVQQRPPHRATGDAGASATARRDAAGQCGAPWALGAAGECATGAGDEIRDPGTEARAADGAADRSGSSSVSSSGAQTDMGAEAHRSEDDLRVVTLEELLQMASAAQPAVGVAVHIQSAAWHNTALAQQLSARNTTFEDLLLQLLQRYGYAMGQYGSEEWRRRPSYLMAFEAGSLHYLAQRTSSPLTQVLGPTIPDTGETWDSATSPRGLRRIRSYAGSVAVARQQLLRLPPAGSAAGPAHAAGREDGRGLVAAEVLFLMRQAGLQVFASFFKPAPRDQLLPGAQSWADEVTPLVLGIGLEEAVEAGAEVQCGGTRTSGCVGWRLGAGIDGLFTDSPQELHKLLGRLRCLDDHDQSKQVEYGDGDGDSSGSSSGAPAAVG